MNLFKSQVFVRKFPLLYVNEQMGQTVNLTGVCTNICDKAVPLTLVNIVNHSNRELTWV